MAKRTYRVLATELVEVSSEVDLTDKEVEALSAMTSQEKQDFLYEKIELQCGDWEQRDRLEIADIELGNEIIYLDR